MEVIMLISAPLVMLNSSAICRLEGAIMVDDKGVKKVSAETIIVAIIFFLRVQLIKMIKIRQKPSSIG
jgi:hypothetical protein